MSPEILNQEQMLTHVRAQIKARYGAIKTAAYELDINPDHLSKMVRGVRPMSGLCWQRAADERPVLAACGLGAVGDQVFRKAT
jgi:hypothetical protein